MSKIVLDDITSGYNLIKISENFQRIEDALNTNVLWRSPVMGEPNSMTDDLDMNSHRIYNLPSPASPNEAARLADVRAAVLGVTQSNLIDFYQAGTGAIARTAQEKLRENVSVKDFGAAGDGSTDDTLAIQAAVNQAQTIRGALWFPPANAGGFYKITSPIVFTSPIYIRGHSAFGVVVMATGFTAGQYIFDFNFLAASVIENITVSGLTLRSNNGLPNAMRLGNASYVLIKDVLAYNVTDGVFIDGTRCFTHSYEQLNSVAISGATVKFGAGFTGGGQFVFTGCTFSGSTGVTIPPTAALDNLSFVGCNWEQCVVNSMSIAGTVAALSVSGCRTEGCDAVDFNFRPFGAAEYIGGVSITGTVFSASDAGGASRITMGGDSGKVRGFNISGNVVTHGTDAFSGAFVALNGEGESGVISGNFLRGTTCVVVSEQRAGVIVFGNENLAGKLGEWWGFGRTASGSFTATATGMTTSPTGSIKYTAIAGVVVLDIPSISGTSNATTFTLTGSPSLLNPLVDKDVVCRVQDASGVLTSGILRAKTTGVFELYSSVAGNGFTASGTKSVGPITVTYSLL